MLFTDSWIISTLVKSDIVHCNIVAFHHYLHDDNKDSGPKAYAFNKKDYGTRDSTDEGIKPDMPRLKNH